MFQVVDSNSAEVQGIVQGWKPTLHRYTPLESQDRYLVNMSKIEQDFQKASKEFQRLQAGESITIKSVHLLRVFVAEYATWVQISRIQ